MRKHGYNEVDIGAAQIRLVSYRVATIISFGDGCTGTLTEFVKFFRAHSEALKNDAIVSDVGCIERLVGICRRRLQRAAHQTWRKCAGRASGSMLR
jgi:hypothetical protein